MKTIASLLLALLPVTVALHAADAPELTRLRDSYKAAVAKTTKPWIQTHINDLEKLRDTYARSAKLDAANKVQGDIDAAYQAMAFADKNPPTTAPASASATAAVATPELDRLRESHKAALEKATKLLTQTYVKELEKLRDTYTRTSNLDGANQVQTEIAAANPPAEPPSAAPIAATIKPPRLTGKAPHADWYIGKTWISDRGTQWTFAKGGKGEVASGAKKSPLSWKVLQSGLIEMSGQSSTGTGITTWWVQFISPTEAIYGSGPKDLDKAMRPK